MRRKPGDEVGTLNSEGYLVVNVRGKVYHVAHIVWLLYYGELPWEIDHINRVGSNNRIENLRRANRSVNNRNRGTNSNNTSGHTGVSRHKSTGKWLVTAYNKYVGLFPTKEEAIAARMAALASDDPRKEDETKLP